MTAWRLRVLGYRLLAAIDVLVVLAAVVFLLIAQAANGMTPEARSGIASAPDAAGKARFCAVPTFATPSHTPAPASMIAFYMEHVRWTP